MTLSQPNDFAKEVLEICKKRKITFHGCNPWFLSYDSGGDLKMWFYGHRDRRAWAGGVTLKHRDDIENAVIRGDCNVLADALEQIIDHTQTRFK